MTFEVKMRRGAWLLSVLLLILLSALAAHRWSRRAISGAGPYASLAIQLGEYALPTESVAVPPAGVAHFADWPTVELPEGETTSTLLTALQAARPDYVVVPHSVAWDGVRVQPWFQAHYQVFANEFEPYEATTPLVLYRYTPTPFDDDHGEAKTCTGGTVAEMTITNCRWYGPRLLPALPLYLALELRGTTDLPVRTVLSLVAVQDERTWFQEERQLATDLWYPDLPVEQKYLLVPPEKIPVGAYRLELAFYRPNQALLGDPLILTTLQVPPTVSLDPPQPEYPLQMTYGEGIQLVGYDAPVRAAPGDTVRIALYWHTLQALPIDYTVFIHLLGGNGEVLVQEDVQPVQWTYPTTEWQSGEYIRDEHLLALPAETPRGDWWLTVGLYDAETGERLAVRKAAGAVLSERRVMLFRLQVR